MAAEIIGGVERAALVGVGVLDLWVLGVQLLNSGAEGGLADVVRDSVGSWLVFSAIRGHIEAPFGL